MLISLVYSQSARLQVLYFGVLVISSWWDESFSHATECKLIVVHYSCLLLCLEQILPFVWQSSMAWNMLHGLKTKERGNNQEMKTQQKQNNPEQWFSFNSRAVSSFHQDTDKINLHTRSTYYFFLGFRLYHMVFIHRLVCSVVMEL